MTGPLATTPRAVDLVIFDCDGVLVDSERLTVAVESRLLTELGWALTEADIVERFVGRSDTYMLDAIEAHFGRPVPEWGPLYREAQEREFRSRLEPVSGVVEALDRLDELGYSRCVASSGTHEKMALTLGLTGLAGRFEQRVFSATEVAHGKPAPDLFVHAAARMGVAPSRCVVIEDSPSGVAAARAADMACIALATPLISAENLAGPGTTVISDMDELVQTVETVATRPPPPTTKR